MTALIPAEHIAAARRRRHEGEPTGPVVLGVKVGDELAVAHRFGAQVFMPYARPVSQGESPVLLASAVCEQIEMAAAAARHFTGWRHVEVNIWEPGVGLGLIDVLSRIVQHEKLPAVVRQPAAGPGHPVAGLPLHPDVADHWSHLWLLGRDRLVNNPVCLDVDSETADQLATPTLIFNTGGKLQAQPTRMKHGLDRAVAVLIALSVGDLVMDRPPAPYVTVQGATAGATLPR